MSIETELQERIGRLTTAFTAANTAITGKGGTAADDITGLASAIGTIQTGVPLPQLTDPAAADDILAGKEAIDGNGNKISGSLQCYDPFILRAPTESNSFSLAQSKLTDHIYVNFPNLNYWNPHQYWSSENVKNIHWKFSDNVTYLGKLGGYITAGKNCDSLYLDFSTKNVTRFNSTFKQSSNYGGFYRIYGDIDLSSVTVDIAGIFPENSEAKAGAFKHIRFVPNTASVNLNFQELNNPEEETLISIANCLKEGVAGKTLTLAIKNAYNNSLSMMGYSRLSDDGTYHIFEKNENGDISLAGFIQNVKGWTFAAVSWGSL